MGDLNVFNVLEIASNFSNDSQNRWHRIILYLFYIFLTVELSIIVASKVGFVYVNNKDINLNTIIVFFTTYQLFEACIIFYLTYFLSKKLVSLSTSMFGFVLYACMNKTLKKDPKYFDDGLIILGILNKDKNRGKNFKIVIRFFALLDDENNIMIRVCDFIESTVILTLYLYIALHNNFHFSKGWDNFILIVLWLVTIYWFINIGFWKGVKMQREKIKNFMFNIHSTR